MGGNLCYVDNVCIQVMGAPVSRPPFGAMSCFEPRSNSNSHPQSDRVGLQLISFVSCEAWTFPGDKLCLIGRFDFPRLARPPTDDVTKRNQVAEGQTKQLLRARPHRSVDGQKPVDCLRCVHFLQTSPLLCDYFDPTVP
jgi:hypothetical protein